MLTHLRESLLAMQQRDLSVRAELEADGPLFDGYNPLMEAVHRENASQLRQLITEHGWPHEAMVGADGAEAAWLIAQHSISDPAFMRACLELLAAEAAAGRIPRWQHAFLHDRARTLKGKPQRYGTQIELTPQGAVVCEVEDPQRLDALRKEAGLGPIDDRLKAFANAPLPSDTEFKVRKSAELAWRRKVGWI
jgi:hypothetical protein